MPNKVTPSSKLNSGSLQSILTRIIERLYTKPSQNSRRVVLKAYFSQSATQHRSLTLEQLGKLDELEKPLTRERARQIIAQFKQVFADQVKKLDGPLPLGMNAESNRQDMLALKQRVERIVQELATFPRPIFAWRVQPRLVKLSLVDEATYLPIVLELAEAMKVQFDFIMWEEEGYKVILNKGDKFGHFTKDIVAYMGKRATHNGGVFPIEAIADTGWDSGAPKSIGAIAPDIREKYLLDLIKFDGGELLDDQKFFAFMARDERISTILLAVFTTYKSALNRNTLVEVVQKSIRHRLLSKKKSVARERELQVLEDSANAIDEFCLSKGLLKRISDELRDIGPELMLKLEHYQPGKLVQLQQQMVQLIREHGQPLDSMAFGRLVREELGAAESDKTALFSYPALYLQRGATRRNYTYHTLDNLYGKHADSGKSEFQGITQRLKTSHLEVAAELEELDKETHALSKVRQEQGLLREYLLAMGTNNPQSAQCQICHKHFPHDLLVAAHVKKRADCTDQEKRDIENVAMLQCRSCDALFERHYIYLQDDGTITINTARSITSDLSHQMALLSGKISLYVNGGPRRLDYLRHHRTKALE